MQTGPEMVYGVIVLERFFRDVLYPMVCSYRPCRKNPMAGIHWPFFGLLHTMVPAHRRRAIKNPRRFCLGFGPIAA